MSLSKQEILNKLSELKHDLHKKYGVKSIGLFGSYSDNSYNEFSDVDILVEFEKPIGWSFFNLESELEDNLGKKIDLVTIQALKSRIKDNILNQVIYI